MKSILFIIIVGVIFGCGLIIGMNIGEDIFVLKKVNQIKGIATAAVEIPIKTVSNVAVFPFKLVGKMGGTLTYEITKIVNYPVSYLRKNHF